MKAVIDCTSSEKYLTLGIWGKPVFCRVIDIVFEADCFDDYILVTDNPYIKYITNSLYNNQIIISNDFPKNGVVIDGRAANMVSSSIRTLVKSLDDNKLYELSNLLDDEQRLLVDSSTGFEISLINYRKKTKTKWLREMVLNRISEKNTVLSEIKDKDEICFLGHSQFDMWRINKLLNYRIRNCGISGITIREYIDDIIKPQRIVLPSSGILILLGVNDIALDKSIYEILNDYIELLELIKNSSKAEVYCIQTLLVNGRLDRDNQRIIDFNNMLKSALSDRYKWIETDSMNDDFGHLDFRYTNDGLHLNEFGYEKLKEILEKSLLKYR